MLEKINRVFGVSLLLILLFSCAPDLQLDHQAAERLSPVEKVRQLAEENNRFIEHPSVSTDSHSPEIRAILNRGEIIFGMTVATPTG